MPPRFVYWTILAGGLPTAFRAADREELLPTFRQIRSKHPDAEMKYFARGKLWASQEEARHAADAARARPKGVAGRGREWRPGGEHHDPRQKFKNAQKARNQKQRTDRFERRTRDDGDRAGVRREKPQGDPSRRTAAPRPAPPRPPSRPAAPRPAPPRPGASRRPPVSRPRPQERRRRS